MTDTTTVPDLGRPLRRALPRMVWATGLDAAMSGPVSHGGRRLVVTDLHGMLTTTMIGLVATPGMGIGGKVLQLGRPAAVNDYLHSAAASHHFDRKVVLEQVRGALAAPVRVGGVVRAVMSGVARTAEPIGDRAPRSRSATAPWTPPRRSPPPSDGSWRCGSACSCCATGRRRPPSRMARRT